MKRLIISELEKKYILNKHNLLNESSHALSDLPSNIQSSIKKLYNCIGRDLSKSNKDISKEFDQEGATRDDNGGVNTKAKEQIKKLLSDIKSNFPDVEIKLVSGYRSYDDQVSNFCGKVKKGRSFDDVQAAVTLPGFSQHHTGKAFDIISTSENYWDNNPKLTKWVADNCEKYGFEVTYKTQGVLREKEPWHLYYVGGEKESEITTNDDEKNIPEKKIDDFYSTNTQDPEFEKKTEETFKLENCRPKKKYTQSPSFDDVKQSTDIVIRIGHMGEFVKKIQKFLQKNGYDIGVCGVDGYFGPKTKEALEKLQSDLGVNVSSSFDKSTLEKVSSSKKNETSS